MSRSEKSFEWWGISTSMGKLCHCHSSICLGSWPQTKIIARINVVIKLLSCSNSRKGILCSEWFLVCKNLQNKISITFQNQKFDAQNRYESTDVHLRIRLHMLSWVYGSSAVTITNKQVTTKSLAFARFWHWILLSDLELDQNVVNRFFSKYLHVVYCTQYKRNDTINNKQM